MQMVHTHTQTTLSHPIFRHTIFHTPLCHTPSFTHNFVTRSLSHTTFTHTIFHTQLCHTHTIFLCHTPSFTYNFVSHNFVLLLDPPPPPLSFLLSPSLPQQHLVLIIGRSCLVGLSGPLFFFQMRSKGSRFTLGVWGLRVCWLDVAFIFATVRNRSQPFATVHNRQHEPRMAVPMVSSAKGGTLGGFT